MASIFINASLGRILPLPPLPQFNLERWRLITGPRSSRSPNPNIRPLYSLLPVDTNSIRLIKIRPEAGSIDKYRCDPELATHYGFSVRDAIVCSIEVSGSQNAPPYDALSYTWGNPFGLFKDEQHEKEVDRLYAKRLPIICNGNIVEVGLNLFDALVFLRAGSRMGRKLDDIKKGLTLSEYIWIDAICIDQSNLDERNIQVKAMDNIYQNAQRVIVWLGAEDSTVSGAAKIVGAIGRSGLSLVANAEQFQSSKRMSERHYPDHGLPAFAWSEWLSLLMLYSRTWFHRMWILQEIILSQDSIVFCGFTWFRWPYLEISAQFLSRTGWAADIISEALRDGYKVKKNKSLFNIPTHISQTRCNLGLRSHFYTVKSFGPPDFLDLLHLFRSAKCSEAKDKIYAVRGLLKGDDNAKIVSRITVDYKMPDFQIYLQAAWGILSSQRNLNLLSHVADITVAGLSGLPSWVPDWTIPEPSSVLRDVSSKEKSETDAAIWNVSAGLEWVPPDIDNFSHTLAVQGRCVGLVKKVFDTPKLFENAEPLSQVFHLVQQRYSISQTASMFTGPSTKTAELELHRCPPLPYTRLEALWRTLIMDRWEGGYPATHEAGNAFARALIMGHLYLPLQRDSLLTAIEKRQYNWEVLKSLSEDEKICIDQQSAKTSTPPWPKGPYLGEPPAIETPTKFLPNFEGSFHSGNWREFSDWVFEETNGSFSQWRTAQSSRPLIITDTGLLGLGSFGVENSDEVWILAGARVPFLLRQRREGRYQVVGEAYVHGIMNGEAVSQLGSLQNITLE